MGTRTIVASVVPVPDAAARRMMLAFHRNLAGGDAPGDGAREGAGPCRGAGLRLPRRPIARDAMYQVVSCALVTGVATTGDRRTRGHPQMTIATF